MGENPLHPFPHSNLLVESGGSIIPPYVSPTTNVEAFALFLAMKTITMIEQNPETLRHTNGLNMACSFQDSLGNAYSFTVNLLPSQLIKVANWEQSLESTFASSLGTVIQGNFIASNLSMIPTIM